MARSPRLEQTRPTGHGRARGLVSQRASGERIVVHTYQPPAELADVVASYWCGAWLLANEAPHTSLLLSDPCAHFVFEDADGVPNGARVVGVWTQLWRRELAGDGRALGIKLRAGALRAFVDEPAEKFTDDKRALATLFGAQIGALHEAIASERDHDAVFGHVGRWLEGRRIHDHDHDIALAIELVDKITADSELTSVAQLADTTGLGVRDLQRLFRDFVGAPPKWVIRRNRLQEVALRIERGEHPTLADLATTLGYADQAHLARDFKNAVGMSPSAFRAQHAADPNAP